MKGFGMQPLKLRHIYIAANFTKQHLQTLLSVSAYRNRWRRNNWHCCTEKQCSEARDQTDLQIAPGKGERNSWNSLMQINVNLWIGETQHLTFFLSQVYNKTLCLICPQDLMKDLKSELSKNLERLIIGLMLTPAEFDAKMMRKAMEVQLIQIT